MILNFFDLMAECMALKVGAAASGVSEAVLAEFVACPASLDTSRMWEAHLIGMLTRWNVRDRWEAYEALIARLKVIEGQGVRAERESVRLAEYLAEEAGVEVGRKKRRPGDRTNPPIYTKPPKRAGRSYR